MENKGCCSQVQYGDFLEHYKAVHEPAIKQAEEERVAWSELVCEGDCRAK